MKTIVRILPLCFVCAVATLSSGCAALILGTGLAAGAGGYAYYKGEMKAVESASLARTFAATEAALKKLNFEVLVKTEPGMEAELEGHLNGKREFQVHLKQLAETATEIRIRSGVFGDEPASLRLLKQIQGGLPPPSATKAAVK